MRSYLEYKSSIQNGEIIVGSHARGENSPLSTHRAELIERIYITEDHSCGQIAFSYSDDDSKQCFPVTGFSHPELFLDAYAKSESGLWRAKRELVTGEQQERTLKYLKNGFKWHFKIVKSGGVESRKVTNLVHYDIEEGIVNFNQYLGYRDVKQGLMRGLQIAVVRRLVASSPEYFLEVRRPTLYDKLQHLSSVGLIGDDYRDRVSDLYLGLLSIHANGCQEVFYNDYIRKGEVLRHRLSRSEILLIKQVTDLLYEINENQKLL